jgi:hypothetical protein
MPWSGFLVRDLVGVARKVGRKALRAAQRSLATSYEPNSPLFGSAFCPLLGRKGASARVSSFSRKLGGL